MKDEVPCEFCVENEQRRQKAGGAQPIAAEDLPGAEVLLDGRLKLCTECADETENEWMCEEADYER